MDRRIQLFAASRVNNQKPFAHHLQRRWVDVDTAALVSDKIESIGVVFLTSKIIQSRSPRPY